MTASDSARVQTTDDGVVVERVFDAPPELIWRAWTEPEHVRRWYGPASMTSHVCEIDLRVGGRYRWGMQTPDGQEYFTTGVYQEIVPGERFVATASDAAPEGGSDQPPMETTISVTLEDLGDGRTKMTLNHSGFPASDMAAHAGGGWNQAFDKMAAALTAA